MFLNDGRLVVIIEDAVVDGHLAVYALSAILALAKNDHEFTGDVKNDFIDSFNAGRVIISDRRWKAVQRWSQSGKFITIDYTQSKRYVFGFVTKTQLKKREYTKRDGTIGTTGYLTEDELRWIDIWIEAMGDMARRTLEADKPNIVVADAEPSKPKKKRKKRKARRAANWRSFLEEGELA